MTADTTPDGLPPLGSVVRELGLSARKSLGQHFILDLNLTRRIARAAGPLEGRTVVEVGPGPGGLTRALLLEGAERVIAVERDERCRPALDAIAARYPGRLEVHYADALGTDWRGLVAGSAGQGIGRAVIAANLPYNVAVPVVLHLLAGFPSIARGIVMVQAEVADRMCAGPGSRVYGVPSAKLAWYAQARLAGTVPRTVFWPVPNVDSKLVAFTRHDPPVSAASRTEVFTVIDAAFGQRRKTLRAALSSWAGSPDAAERIVRAAGVSPGARGESLEIAEFARIAQAKASLAEGRLQ